MHGDACRAGKLDHGAACDAFQNARLQRRREQLAVADQKHVVACTLGHFALVIEHQRLGAAGLQPFQLGKDVVEVIERFDPRAERRRMISGDADGDDLKALAINLLGIERDVVGDDDHLWARAAVGVQPQRAGAAGDDDADVAVLDTVDRQGLLDGLGHFLAGHGNRQEDGLGRLPEAVEVGLHAEHLAAIAANALEYAIAIEQAVVVDADLGVFLAVELAVDKDLKGHFFGVRRPAAATHEGSATYGAPVSGGPFQYALKGSSGQVGSWPPLTREWEGAMDVRNMPGNTNRE